MRFVSSKASLVELVTSREYEESSLIFLMDVNFNKFIVRLHILIISSRLKKKKKLKINSYVINQIFKFQVFIVLIFV